jgi:hypothetical protein
MPRVYKSTRTKIHTGYWIVAVLAAASVGVLIGYEQWGTTAAVVSVVEKEMATTQAYIKRLEKRVGEMEMRLIGEKATISGNPSTEPAAKQNVSGSTSARLERRASETEGKQ